ncbi:glycosyl hydrolase 115 family protein [Croceibacterium ferulae]|uniref:glycosyl hydrolase 115 family protein n=1 Tax=Croceibacterium ferulae TaxID=1854641 RepID=UPI000EAE3934|nr:glycosyl hydrolase 115 family protein [Croceibacterium ferulae]
MRARHAILAVLLCAASAPASAQSFALDDAAIIYDDTGSKGTMRLAAEMLADDLAALTGTRPAVSAALADCAVRCVLIGRHDAPLIAAAAGAGAGLDLSPLAGGWERYVRGEVAADGRRMLVIAGSDRRGAVYGAVDLSRGLGISPWIWWADVQPRLQDTVAVDGAPILSDAPDVQYRGIFLNDEDWGLLPWAAATQDPDVGNIGPNTYARVFQLMWRLKANTLWPAMHAVSKQFFADARNMPLAEQYGIVIGTSHAEPMMRNNLREWDEAERGPFDFTRQPRAIADYWRERVGEVGGAEAIFTMGLRGLHDGPMQGVTSTAERSAILQRVFGLQQQILADALATPLDRIPQVYVAYHELQEAYDAGLAVPDDITLMWTDDNYGYLRRLGSPQERARSGGMGIYYHLSYWGRPHDYLWLGTTHPSLIREQMGRAWDNGARRMWIVNSGDIKPIEYLSQYFLDLAFDADLFARDPREHLRSFMAEQFGEAVAPELAAIMADFYDLAWERRPEFMGFGETEWVTPNHPTAYVDGDGEEAQERLAAHAALVARAEAAGRLVAPDRQDAYFELVLYSVRAAALLNERILRLDLAGLYARQHRASANHYVAAARRAHNALVADTDRYNALAGGKWRGMMDPAPRALPVFAEPMWPQWSSSPQTGCDAALWGEWINDENTLLFTRGQAESRTLTLFSRQSQATGWQAGELPAGLKLSASGGMLDDGNGWEQRLTLSYDGAGDAGSFTLACGGAEVPVHTRVAPPLVAAPGEIAEHERRVVIPATGGEAGTDWQMIDWLGSTGGVLRSSQALAPAAADGSGGGTPVSYRFVTRTDTGAGVRVVALPTHPSGPDVSQRLAITIDGGAARIVDLATTGRSDVWRGNVLTNTAVAEWQLPVLAPGHHTLDIVPLDPGIMLDRVEIAFDRARPRYVPRVAPR